MIKITAAAIVVFALWALHIDNKNAMAACQKTMSHDTCVHSLFR